LVGFKKSQSFADDFTSGAVETGSDMFTHTLFKLGGQGYIQRHGVTLSMSDFDILADEPVKSGQGNTGDMHNST
jgi:hypothetical protein